MPVEYRTRHFIGALKKAGYDEKRKTLFIWEGVTYYINPATK